MEGISVFYYIVIAIAAIAATIFVVAWQKDLKDLEHHRQHDCGKDGQRVCTYSTPRLELGCLRIHEH